MANPRTDDGSAQEFQLETRHLVLLILVVIVLCVASFLFGRWVERQRLGPTLASGAVGGSGEDANIEDMGDVSKDLTFFDTLDGNRPAPLKPSSSAPTTSPTARPPVRSTSTAINTPPPATSPRRSVNEGVMIQVFASKDRAAADTIRRRLRSKGYTALLVPDRGTYKVRVGPYADREEATRAASVLREQEKLTTWIP